MSQRDFTWQKPTFPLLLTSAGLPTACPLSVTGQKESLEEEEKDFFFFLFIFFCNLNIFGILNIVRINNVLVK